MDRALEAEALYHVLTKRTPPWAKIAIIILLILFIVILAYLVRVCIMAL